MSAEILAIVIGVVAGLLFLAMTAAAYMQGWRDCRAEQDGNDDDDGNWPRVI